jgi:hypothetical protein
MKKNLLGILFLSFYTIVNSQDATIVFSEPNSLIRQSSLLGVNNDQVIVSALGAKMIKYNINDASVVSSDGFVDKKLRSRYATADMLNIELGDNVIYTLWFKKAGSNYEMMMGKYDFNQQTLIEDKIIDANLANTSYYSIEEGFIHMKYQNNKIYVLFNNLNGSDKTICTYILDENLNLIANGSFEVPKQKTNQYFDKLIIGENDNMWLVRDLQKMAKPYLFFDIRYSMLTSSVDFYDFYKFSKNGNKIEASNFSYDPNGSDLYPPSFYSMGNDLVMGYYSTEQQKGISSYVFSEDGILNPDNAVELTPFKEMDQIVGAEEYTYSTTLVGTNSTGSMIFTSNIDANGKKIGIIEEIDNNGKHYVYEKTRTLRDYNIYNSYIHVNTTGNYVLIMKMDGLSLKVMKVNLTDHSEHVTVINNLKKAPSLTCKITNSGDFYIGYWFENVEAYTGGIFILNAK